MLKIVLATIAAVISAAAPALAANASVTTSGTTFDPSSATILAGEHVTITNTGGGFHNVRWADRAQAEMALSNTAWSTQRTLSEPGTFVFYCEAHGTASAGMRGTVTVEEPPETYVWEGGNGAWTEPTNWAPDGTPGPGDAVVVGSGSPLLDAPVTIATLDVDSAGRGGPGTLTVTKSGTWTGATFAGGTTVVGPGANVSFDGRIGGNGVATEIENQGTLNTGLVQFGDGGDVVDPAVLDNQGALDVAGNLTDASAGGGRVENAGDLRGTESVEIAPPIANAGSVTAEAGTLDLSGGSASPASGDFAAVRLATLRFSGAFAGAAGTNVSGAGRVEVPGRFELTGSVDGQWSVSGATQVDGDLILRGDAHSGSFSVDGGDVTVLGGQLTIGGSFPSAWIDPTLAGDGAIVGDVVTINSLTLTDSLTIRLAGSGILGDIRFGDGDGLIDPGPRLELAGTATLTGDTSMIDRTDGGSPVTTVLAGGKLDVNTTTLSLGVPFETAGTLALYLLSSWGSGAVLTTSPFTLGGALEVSLGQTPTEPQRIITTAATPDGQFTTTPVGYSVTKDASGVLLTKLPDPPKEPEAPVTPTPEAPEVVAPTGQATPVPTAAPTPAPTAVPAPPKLAQLVKLRSCARRGRAVKVRLLAGVRTVKVMLGRRTIQRSAKAFTLKRPPKRRFRLRFEVTLDDGRVVKGSRKFKPCKR